EKKEPIIIERLAYFLPDKLQYNSTVQPEKRYRGIYEVMLYASGNKMKGNFSPLPLKTLGLVIEDMVWEKAFIAMNISDSRGLKDELQMNWNNTKLTLSPGSGREGFLKESFMAPVPLTITDSTASFEFSAEFALNGSEE